MTRECRDAGASQGRCCEMAKIMNAQRLDAREFCHASKPFPKIPRLWPLEIPVLSKYSKRL